VPGRAKDGSRRPGTLAISWVRRQATNSTSAVSGAAASSSWRLQDPRAAGAARFARSLETVEKVVTARHGDLGRDVKRRAIVQNRELMHIDVDALRALTRLIDNARDDDRDTAVRAITPSVAAR